MTKYVVLVNTAADGETASWELVGPDVVEASSDREAIRAVAETRGAAEYVAVPARSWNPRTPTVDQIVKVSFGSDS